MATTIPPEEKQAFINIVKVAPYPGGPQEAGRLQDILNNYSDVYATIMRELPLFASNNSYLISAISVFNDDELQSVGIWVNKTISSPPLVNPVLIINSEITDWPVLIEPSSPPIQQDLCILGPTTIDEITVLGFTALTELYLGPGVTLNALDASEDQARVGTIYIKNAKNNPAALNSVVYQSNISQIIQDPGTYFGGVTNDNPLAPCDNPVTNLTTREITNNSVTLNWDTPESKSPPESFLFINVFYRKSGSQTWIAVSDGDGEYVGNTGFVFRYLEKDTFYDFKVSVTCLNGGIADATIYQQTVCCGTNIGQPNDAQEFTAQGDTAFNVEAGSELHSISMFPQGTETINIGTTPGGTDILDAATVTTDGYVLIVDRTFSLTLQTTLYVTGATGIVTYRIIEL